MPGQRAIINDIKLCYQTLLDIYKYQEEVRETPEFRNFDDLTRATVCNIRDLIDDLHVSLNTLCDELNEKED